MKPAIRRFLVDVWRDIVWCATHVVPWTLVCATLSFVVGEKPAIVGMLCGIGVLAFWKSVEMKP
mgnify:FL=1